MGEDLNGSTKRKRHEGVGSEQKAQKKENASHSFALKEKTEPTGKQIWEMDVINCRRPRQIIVSSRSIPQKRKVGS